MVAQRTRALLLTTLAGLLLSPAHAVSSTAQSNGELVPGIGALEGEGVAAQTGVYYNARIALRDGRHEDVLKLWLLRNALESNGVEPLHDGDFRSLLWVALSSAGLCHDGIPADDDADGAGLWPLALHNWLTRSSSRQPPPPQPRTFTSFDTGFQQRTFSLHDVLSVEELRGARFFRGRCFRPYIELPFLGTPHWLDMDDRLSKGIMMRDLIERAQQTLKSDRVRGQVVLETRIFDIEVALGKLAKSAARRETGLLAQAAKATGVSPSAMTLQRERRMADVRKSQYTALLRRSLTWGTIDWFSLSQNRRLALFYEATRTYGNDPTARAGLERTLFQNIDALIDAGDGKELTRWLGFAGLGKTINDDEYKPDPVAKDAILNQLALGERGERLLGLEKETGFRERAVIAIRRGTHALSIGEPMEAMRAFALAMKRSEDSRSQREVHNLAKRWFAYVLSQHAVNDEALELMRAFVSSIDRNELLEILLWRAAFHADVDSFEKIVGDIRKGGALDFRVRMLRMLAEGDPGAMYTSLQEEREDSPHSIYKFVKRLAEELSTEDLEVRMNNRATLELGKALLNAVAETANRGLQKKIAIEDARLQALLDGLDAFDASAAGRARAAAPNAEAYAGALRLAPADPLPWPFAEPRVQPPSPFSAIVLEPVEWLDDDGRRIFGWHIREKDAFSRR